MHILEKEARREKCGSADDIDLSSSLSASIMMKTWNERHHRDRNTIVVRPTKTGKSLNS